MPGDIRQSAVLDHDTAIPEAPSDSERRSPAFHTSWVQPRCAESKLGYL